MIKVTTIQTLVIPDGVLELSKDQVKRRALSLEKIGKAGNKYQVLYPVQFKAGEQFGMESVPKHMKDFLEYDESENERAEESSE